MTEEKGYYPDTLSFETLEVIDQLESAMNRAWMALVVASYRAQALAHPSAGLNPVAQVTMEALTNSLRRQIRYLNSDRINLAGPIVDITGQVRDEAEFFTWRPVADGATPATNSEGD